MQLNYTLLATIAVFTAIVYGVPHYNSFRTGLPVGVQKMNISENREALPTGMTRVSTKKNNEELPEGFTPLATNNVWK